MGLGSEIQSAVKQGERKEGCGEVAPFFKYTFRLTLKLSLFLEAELCLPHRPFVSLRLKEGVPAYALQAESVESLVV